MARDFLAALFWPDEEGSKGRANLSRELHNLGRILPDCWVIDRQTVAFFPSANTIVDIDELVELEAQECWGRAATLLGGEFLEGLILDDNAEFENWLLSERERWRGYSAGVLRQVIDEHLRRGQYSGALLYAQRLLQSSAWDEVAHQYVMRLLAWTGQRSAALRQFEICKQMLREELGIDPSEETIALHQQIQAGDLKLPPQLPGFLTEESARHEYIPIRCIEREDELAKLDKFFDEVLNGKSRVVFISGGPGRGKTTLLEAFSQRAMDTHPNLLVVGGKCNAYSGVGDPYLPYLDVMAMLTGDVETRWDAGAITRDHARRLWAAFPTIVQVLLNNGPNLIDIFASGSQLLSRVLAAGNDHATNLPRLREFIKLQQSRKKDVEHSLLFQQFTTVLLSISKSHPVLLILDDLQWADTASISLLFHLGRRLTEMEGRLLIACAYRPEEVSMIYQGKHHQLSKVLSEFKRTFGEIWIDLGRIDKVKDRRFVDTLLDIEQNRLGESFRDALFNRTGGHPLFTIELLRAMQDRGDLIKDSNDSWVEGPTLDWELLPARVEALIKERIDWLDSDLQEILTIASVEGEVFTAQVVAEVQSMEEKSILRWLSRDLEMQHRLVIEQEEVVTGQRRMSRYSFRHILIRDYLYKRLSHGERKLLHGAVAAALEKLYEGQQIEIAVQLAHHYYQAGDPEQAFFYYTMAGDRATRMFASWEAITHYTRAIQLADKVTLDDDFSAKLYCGRGLAYGIVGEHVQARADLETALQIANKAKNHQVEWRTLIDLGRLWSSRNHNQAREYFEAALVLARQLDDPAVLAGSLNWMGNWYTNDDDYRMAVTYHQEALTIFEDLRDQRELANTLDFLGIANLMGGDLDASTQNYNTAVAIARELNDRQRLASSLMGRATTYSMLVLLVSASFTLPHEPMFDINEALRIATEVDSASERIWAYWSSGLLYILCGDFGRALKRMKSGLRFATKIEHREWVVGTRFGLGILYVELFSPEQAQRHLDAALSLASELHSPMWTHFSCGALAAAHLMMGNHEAAKECLKSVISFDASMETLSRRYCWVRRVELALMQDDPTLALDITERLIASAPNLSPGHVITYLWKLKAEALATTGQLDDARTLLCAARKNAQDYGERFLLWRIHGSLGKLYRRMDCKQASEKELLQAQAIIDELSTTLQDQKLKQNFLAHASSTLYSLT